MRGRRPARETRYGKIKAAPEKVHWTALPAEARPELLENAVALHENAPEPFCIFAVEGTVSLVAIKRDWMLNLVGHHVDAHGQLEIAQRPHHGAIKVRH